MKNEELNQIIEKSFKTEPDFHLSANFAKNLTFLVSRREQWKTDLHEYLFLTAILFFLFAVVSGTYYFIDKAIVVRFFTFIKGNALPVVFITLIMNFILFADRVLLRLLFRRWSKT